MVRGCVDDAAAFLLRSAHDIVREHLHLVGIVGEVRVHGEIDVRPAESADHFGRTRHAESSHDVVADRWRGRRGERQASRATDCLERGCDAEIVGPEVRSPLTHEMRFVDGDELGLQGREALEHVGVGELLGAEKDEVRAVLCARQLFEGTSPLARRNGRVHRDGNELTVRCQCGQLIALQRDQRRDHHSRPAEQEPRELVDRRLAAARRHDGERVVSVEHALDGFELTRSQ